jgi:hypothetical protein
MVFGFESSNPMLQIRLSNMYLVTKFPTLTIRRYKDLMICYLEIKKVSLY